MTNLGALYGYRFRKTGLEKRRSVWKILTKHYFSKFVPINSVILDAACGYGEFINNIEAAEKYAVDLNKDAPKFLSPEVNFVHTSATDLSSLPQDRITVAFTSNFLEHFLSKDDLDAFLQEIYRLLTPGGRFIILGPNIRYAYKEYWDYYDHHIPLSHLSAVEALIMAGFQVETVIDRFLPYTMNNNAPTSDLAIKTYLKLPFAWRFFGKQFLITVIKPA
jgi:SAM-dependent methyltransferase